MSPIFATVFSSSTVFAADTITVALTAKAFQYTILPLAQVRGYMKKEGLDMKLTYMQSDPSLQAVMAGSAHFSGAGSSALVGISKGNAPMKTVLALNDQVLQWVVARPNVAGLPISKAKKSRPPVSLPSALSCCGKSSRPSTASTAKT